MKCASVKHHIYRKNDAQSTQPLSITTIINNVLRTCNNVAFICPLIDLIEIY